MRSTRIVPLVLCCVAIAVACGKPVATEANPAEAPEAGDPASADEAILPRPFTADQIRSEMIVGFSMDVYRATPKTESLTRWTVVSADDEGVEIEYATLDADGYVVGDSEIERSGWTELRDHATFPVETSTRAETTRLTPLGTLDGWLYTVRDDEAGTVTEFFFARDLPGAPVEMRVLRGDQVLTEMTQRQRHRPS